MITHIMTALAHTEPTATAQTTASLPLTRRDNVRETLHGVEITDPYRWLEDQESQETRDWLQAQDAHTRSFLERLPGRDSLKKRLTELLKVDSIGIPTERQGFYFLSKRDKDQDQAVLYRRKGLQGQDEVLIDPHAMSADHTTSVTMLDISKDGSLLVYAIRQGGEDEIEVRLMDVSTRQDLPDRLPKARFMGVSLKPDKSGFYYTRHESATGSRVYYHATGTDAAQDREIFGAGYGPDKGISAALSEEGRYLTLTVWHGSAAVKSEIYVQNVEQNGPLLPIVNDLDARFTAEIAGDSLYLQTNWQAPNGRIFQVDLHQPERGHWREIVPTGEAVIEDFSLIGGKLFVNTLQNVASHVREYTVDGTFLRDLPHPALGSVGGPYGRWDSAEAFYSYTSFPIPTTIYRYDAAAGEQEVWAKQQTPVDTDSLEVRQVFYASKDGTKIPMFLVHAKGMTLDGARPTLLTGYGGFRASLTPYFSSLAALWAGQGGVYAIANLRGGGEYGEQWHEAGMFGKKQNVFDDFIAAAEWLQQNHYTNPSKLAISGGSNGGLLVGAALTQRPELFQAVECAVPLLDMLRYHKFLLAQFWVSEYGSSDDPSQFPYLLAYSPYHRVKPGTKYPAVLFVTGDADTRVAPLHARKMTALLQAETASDRPILLHYDTKSGHVGCKPIRKVVEDLTDTQSFLFHQLGVTL